MMNEMKATIYIPDEELINFSEVNSGRIAAGILFRSSSPLKGGEIKSKIGELAVKAGINCIINLEDIISVIEKLSEPVPWYHTLVLEKKVICLPMTFTIPGVASNEKKLKIALQFMITHNGPYLIHCFAGVDRTGFVTAILEALMGASLKDICKNYMLAIYPDKGDLLSFTNNDKIKGFLTQLVKMAHGKNLTSIENIQMAAENYLLRDVGLSHDEVTGLKNILGGISVTEC
jgi:protein tyrosine/serine phosphatase